MGWEKRGKSGTLYYYRCVRGDGGVATKVYVGRGPRAVLAAAEVAAARRDRGAVAAEALRLAEADRLAAEVAAAADTLAAAALFAGGCHRPNGGPWRRKRERRHTEAGPRAAGGDGAGG